MYKLRLGLRFNKKLHYFNETRSILYNMSDILESPKNFFTLLFPKPDSLYINVLRYY